LGLWAGRKAKKIPRRKSPNSPLVLALFLPALPAPSAHAEQGFAVVLCSCFVVENGPLFLANKKTMHTNTGRLQSREEPAPSAPCISARASRCATGGQLGR